MTMQAEQLEIKTLDQIRQEFITDYISKREKKAKPVSDGTSEVPRETTVDETIKDSDAGQVNQAISCACTPSVWKDLLFLLVKIVIIIVIFLLLFTFLYGIMRYEEPSMAPMINDGDIVLFYRYTKSGYLPRDAVLVEFQGERHVRRVVATAGDTVDISDDGLVINGALQQEPTIYQKTERYQDGITFPVTVPEGHVFVLGDSRADATDSRIYGCVDIKDTCGKVMTVIRRRGV